MDDMVISMNNPEFCEFYDSLVTALEKFSSPRSSMFLTLYFTDSELCVILSSLKTSKLLFDEALSYEKE